jgi:uncharacterized protein (UPF0333 family)
MDEVSREVLQQANRMVEEGNKAGAQKLLSSLAERCPEYPEIWYALSQLADSKEQEATYLSTVLNLQPNHKEAAARLQTLRGQGVRPAIKSESVASTASQPVQSQTFTPVEDAKDKHPSKFVTLLAAVGLLAVICICVVFLASSVNIGGGGEAHRVVLRVDGSSSAAFITYNNAQGGGEQVEVTIPWEKGFTVSESIFLYVAAQNKNDTGTVNCKISVDGKTLKTSSSSGGYVIATCEVWYYP